MRSQNNCLTILKRCLTIPKKVPDNPKNNSLQSSVMFIGIFSEIPKNMPDNKLYRRVQISWAIVRHFFGIVRHISWGCQASFWDCLATFFLLFSLFC